MTCSIYWYFFLKFTFSLNFQGISLLFSSLILLQNDSIFSTLPIFLCFFSSVSEEKSLDAELAYLKEA